MKKDERFEAAIISMSDIGGVQCVKYQNPSEIRLASENEVSKGVEQEVLKSSSRISDRDTRNT